MDTYEKKYNEALERARQIKDGKDEWRYSDLAEIIPALTYIFPQLRESEDERIRKEIIEFVDTTTLSTDERHHRWIAYLEKQKINTEGDFGRGYDCGYQAGYAVAKNEMKPKVATATPDSCKESLHVHESCKENAEYFTQCGDNRFEIIDKAKRDIIAKTNIESSPDEMKVLYSFLFRAWQMGWLGKYDVIVPEQKPELVPHPITYMYPSDASKDERLKMALLALLNSDSIKVAGNKFTQRDLIDWVEQKPNIELIQRSWYMEGYHDREFGMEPRWIIKTGEGGPKHELNPKYGQQKPAEWSEEDNKMRLEAIRVLESGCERYRKESGCLPGWHKVINWLKSLRPQQKPEWSEEDEEMWMDIKRHMIYGSFIPFDKIEWIENRLKSLRPSWKPSEEHLSALLAVFNDPDNIGSQTCQLALTDLYEQLKKL